MVKTFTVTASYFNDRYWSQDINFRVKAGTLIRATALAAREVKKSYVRPRARMTELRLTVRSLKGKEIV